MTPGAAPPSRVDAGRTALTVLGAGCLLAVLVPPVSTLARTHVWVDLVQFGVLAVVVPPLVVLGAPWRWSGTLERVVGSVAGPGARRGAQTVAVLLAELAVLVAWRLPPVVGAVERAHWLVLVEAATLLAAGTALWALLVDTPPFVGREPPLHRLVLATLPMWTVWIVAYVEDMAGVDLSGFHHVAGHGLSASADREVATVVAFLVGAAAFLPVVFFNLMAWLRSEDRPLSLSALARDEAGVVGGALRASGRPPSGARPG